MSVEEIKKLSDSEIVRSILAIESLERDSYVEIKGKGKWFFAVSIFWKEYEISNPKPEDWSRTPHISKQQKANLVLDIDWNLCLEIWIQNHRFILDDETLEKVTEDLFKIETPDQEQTTAQILEANRKRNIVSYINDNFFFKTVWADRKKGTFMLRIWEKTFEYSVPDDFWVAVASNVNIYFRITIEGELILVVWIKEIDLFLQKPEQNAIMSAFEDLYDYMHENSDKIISRKTNWVLELVNKVVWDIDTF